MHVPDPVYSINCLKLRLLDLILNILTWVHYHPNSHRLFVCFSSVVSRRSQPVSTSRKNTNRPKMQFISLFTTAAVLVATVTAQSANTTTSAAASTATATGLVDLVTELPSCALSCLDDAATSIGCTASNLTCLCSNSDDLISDIGPCLLLSGDCTSDEESSKFHLSAQPRGPYIK